MRSRVASDYMKALAHEQRLLILSILSEGEQSVGNLEKMLDLPQPAVSQQLARLRADNLVTTRRSGRTIFYSAARDELAKVLDLLSTLIGNSREPAGQGLADGGAEAAAR